MIDIQKTEQAIRLLLEAIGEDPTREGLLETPHRVAHMYQEILAGYQDDPAVHLGKTFHAENNDLVIEKDIPFYSLCEHHLLPFYGTATIAYIPNGKVAGLSKLARLVDTYAKRLQLQEQMTAQIADDLMHYLHAQGVLVLIQAEHLCMNMRGIKKPGTKTRTLICRGILADDPIRKREALELIR